MGMEVLEELGPERAEQWRNIIQQDEVRQQQQRRQGGDADVQGGDHRHSEVYLSGLPQRSAGLMDILEGGTATSAGTADQ